MQQSGGGAFGSDVSTHVQTTVQTLDKTSNRLLWPGGCHRGNAAHYAGRVHLSDVEIRVLGALLEKQRTTPEAYPLSLNALRLACNQATNRDPVVDYDEPAIRDALHRLGRRRLTRLTSTQGSRAAKFRHLLDETLELGAAEQALLAVLALRGAQTPGELRQRTERMHHFPDTAAMLAGLDSLVERHLAQRLGRRPGQKEERFAHLLGEPDPAAGGTREVPGSQPHPDAHGGPGDAVGTAPAPSPESERLDRLERQVATLSGELAALREELEIRTTPEDED